MEDDDYYRALVEKVETHPALKGVIDKVTNDKSTLHFLNLVDVKWEKKLANNAIYQKIQKETRKCFVKRQGSGDEFAFENLRPSFPLILLATCRFFKQVENSKPETSIVIQECEPLSKIVNAMHSDLRSEDIYLRSDSKFTFFNCSIGCKFCKQTRESLLASGCSPKLVPRPGSTLPCCRFTQVYDGEKVRPTFANEIKHSHSDLFLAILVVEITSRYKFTDQYSPKGKSHRVRGNVYKMVVFDEGKLYNSGMVDEDFPMFDMDTLANRAEPETSPAKRQWQPDPHSLDDDRSRVGKRQKLDSGGPSLSKEAMMDFLTDNDSNKEGGRPDTGCNDDDKSLLEGLNVAGGTQTLFAEEEGEADRLFAEEEGEADRLFAEEEGGAEDTCQFNIVEAYPSTCKMQPRAKLVAHESYEEFL